MHSIINKWPNIDYTLLLGVLGLIHLGRLNIGSSATETSKILQKVRANARTSRV